MLRERILNWLLKAAPSASQGAGILVPNWQSGVPQYNTWDLSKAVKEGYKSSTYVYACIRRIADQASSVPWVVWRKVGVKRVEWQRVEEHPLELLLGKPNLKMTGVQLAKATATYLNLAGNSYWLILDAGGKPAEIYPLRPDYVQPIPDRQTYVAGYQYNVDGDVTVFDAGKVIHFKFIDPANEFVGMSPLRAAARIVDTDNEAVDWNKVSMQNRAVPPGALVTPDNLSDTQYDKLKADIDTKWSGTRNARKPLLLEAGLKWESFSLSPAEMDFIESRKMYREDICSVYGVPPMLVGIMENATLANYETAKRALWEDTIVPYLEDIQNKINAELTPRYGDAFWVEADLSDVPALQDAYEGKVTAAQKLWQMGVPFSQLNERLELGMDDVPNADVQWVPTSMVPMEMAENSPDTGNGTDLGGGTDENAKNASSPSSFDGLKGFHLQTEEQKAAYWRSFERMRTGWYLKAEGQVKRLFRAERKAVLAALKDLGTAGAYAVIEQDREAWKRLLMVLDVSVIQAFGQATAESFKSAKAFDAWTAGVKDWIVENVAQKVVMVTDTTKRWIQRDVDEGIAAGESITQIAQRLDVLYLEQIIPNRSVVIARTEVIGASNAGSRAAALQTGLKLEKVWLSTRDDRTRESHQAADGLRVPMDDLFTLDTGSQLMFPGDSTHGASAQDVVNCRCTEYYAPVG